ncbi:MFS transporter [Microbulbifer sp. VAAF005]|uniref:MFS transporter n=1 Tax=Microbulbifer sp. VAAF005 TaxID=3034230 RepID=UPI0024ACC3FD|nr:MFS transporter [Microbulbifer sp. VAAF005]WHI47105.1 MFS transporter [Microbulbifer sp. VAAF005]
MSTQIEPLDKKIFLVGNLSIFMIGLGLAVRAVIATNLQEDIYNHIDLANSTAMLGEAIGITFAGFAFTLLFGSALVDLVGIKRMLLLSSIGYVLGSLLIIFASMIPPSAGVENLVLIGLLLTGLGWGAVEAASNPMVAAVDPENKTHRLNILHAWWPAGMVVGGLLGLAISKYALPWQLNLVVLLIPAIVLARLVITTKFPVTERVSTGISYGEMFREVFKQPMFILLWVCMWLTAASELAPMQWVDLTLSRVVGMKGILLLVYVSMVMFVMRHFAGHLAKLLSPAGLLWSSSLLAAIGLYSLGMARTPVTAFLAATVWAIGVCYMWPTMLATVSERFVRGGALFLGLLGFAGGMSIQFVLPKLGEIFDNAKIEAAGGLEAFEKLTGDELDAVLATASIESFQSLAVVPLILLPIFAFIWFWDRRQAASKVQGVTAVGNQ